MGPPQETLHMETHFTIGDLQRRTGAPLHRVRHVLETRRVKPAGRVAGIRLFSESDLQFIAAELRRIDAQRGRHVGSTKKESA